MENKDEEICDSDVGDSDKDINASFFPLQDNTMTATCQKSDASPPLSPSQVDTFLSEKNSCLESSNISGLGDNASGAEDNMSSIGDMSGVGENLSGIGDSISGIGENISGMVDRMMAEISPGVMDLSNITSSTGDRGVIDGSDRDSDGSETAPLKQQPDLFEAKHSVEEDLADDQQNLASPRSAHRLPSGPFVVGDQMDITTEMFTGKVPDVLRTSSSSSLLMQSNPLPSPLGLEPNPYLSHSLLDKFKWLPQSPEKHSMKQLLEYQNLTSRPLPRQQKVRTDLSLADKVRLINVSETTGKSQRSLAAEFHISVGSVNNILRRKREYKEAFENKEAPSSSKASRYYRSTKVSAYNELQMLIMRWLEIAKVKIKPLTWPIVMEKAREFATRLNITGFSSSSAWLENLRQSMDIPLRAMPVGVRSENDATLLGMWRKMLPFLVQGYQPENIFSVTETTLYYRCLPDCCYIGGPMCQNSHSHMEVLEHRLTILLCCNILGERLKPLVISRHTCPPTLCGVPAEELPVVWCHQPSAAITADIFAGWLRSLEASMGQQRRHIALFMEMTPSHLSSTLLKHVSLKFYLDDSAHLLQPLNQGIVRDFKAYFRRRLLQTALAQSSASDGGEERDHQTMKTVTELDAMFWIQEAWRSISTDTIRTCFHNAAFPQTSQPSHQGMSGIDPLPNDFLHLVHEAGRTFRFTPMSADIYAEFDSQLPCHRSDMEEWERTLLAEATGGRMKLIKREPSDFVGDDLSACSSQSSSAREGDWGGATAPVQPSEALESLAKLKRFSASNIGLLTTVFELESLLLDSLGSSLRT